MRIALISCAKTKLAGVHEAKDLYVSTRFKLAWEYASKNYDSVYILSAKHGLLAPHTRIQAYDVTLNGEGRARRLVWSRRVVRQMRERLMPSDKIDLFCPKTYREFLPRLLPGWNLSAPLAHLRRGEQMRWYAKHAKITPPALIL